MSEIAETFRQVFLKVKKNHGFLLVLVHQFRRGIALITAISILKIAMSKMKLKLVNTTLQDCIVRNALKDSLVIQLKVVKMCVNPVPVHRQRISK